MNIIRKHIKSIQAKALNHSKIDEEEFAVPEEACDPIIIEGENTTSLSPDKFQLYSDILEFCQGRIGEEAQYTLPEVLRFVDKQLYQFNSLVAEAIESHDLSVLFDLKEALAIVKVSSLQISDALDDFEALTAPASLQDPVPVSIPTSRESSKVGNFIIDRKKPFMQAPMTSIAPLIAAIPGSAPAIEAAPTAVVVRPQPAEAPSPAVPVLAPKGLSPRQAAVARIMAVFSELSDEDIGPVLRQVTGFLELR